MTTRPRRAALHRPSLSRIARIIVIAVLVGVGLSQMILIVGDWHLRDMDAYWDAGVRLREGAPLYPPIADPEASSIYRYAPWFAWLWVPLSMLPRGIANVLWSGILLGASAVALLPLYRRRAWTALALFAPVLFVISGIGNAHPLLIAGLVHGVERRSGPLWIALAASLKGVPILFVLTYLGRREWMRALVTLGLSALIVAPMLLHDLSAYPSGAGDAGGLIAWPPVYVLVVGLAAIIALRLARSAHGWLASAAAVAITTPRMFVYDVTYLMVGDPKERR